MSPLLAHSGQSDRTCVCPLLEVVSTDRRNTLSLTEKMECLAMWQGYRRGFTAAEKTELWDRWQRGGVAQSDWAGVWQAVIFHLLPGGTARGDSSYATASLAIGIDARGA